MKITPIIPMLWGMGYLAIAFIIYPFVGLMWLLVYMGVVGAGGIYIGMRILKSSGKNDKPYEGK